MHRPCRPQVVVAQAERLEAQAETIGRQGAELERATSAVVALGDELEAAQNFARAKSRRLLLALAVLAVLLLVAGAVATAGWAR